MPKIPLSVVVVTKNEEVNIATCMESVADWADEIIVVDDESSDRTVAIAKSYTNKIFHRKMENEGRHRNWAYAQARNEWVLSLDADEAISKDLKREIADVLPRASCEAYSIPQKNYIGDYGVRYSGWYPASKIKLFKKSRFRYEEVEVHPRAFLDGRECRLTKDIIHKSYRNFEHYLTKLNRQTTWEAQKWFNSGKSFSSGFVIRRTVDRFLRSYVSKRGYRDGFVGLMIAFFGSLYQIMSYAKYCEMKNKLSDNSFQ